MSKVYIYISKVYIPNELHSYTYMRENSQLLSNNVSCIYTLIRKDL